MLRISQGWKVLFPDRCLGCGLRDVQCCQDCQSRVRQLPAAVCPRCARAQPLGAMCKACTSRTLSALVASTVFEDVVRAAIHAFKFRQQRSLAPLLAQWMAEGLDRRPISADLVVPVPLSDRRLRERGFNQSELLARALVEIQPAAIGVLELGALVRTRDTKAQFGLGGSERRRNVRGAFACIDPVRVRGARILLIDDVTTTGATLEACARPLVEGGARRVMALTVAKSE